MRSTAKVLDHHQKCFANLRKRVDIWGVMCHAQTYSTSASGTSGQSIPGGTGTNSVSWLIPSIAKAPILQKYFNVEWPDRAIYHAMVNTSIGDEAVLQMVLTPTEMYGKRAIA